MTDSSARRSLVDLDQVIDLSAERPDAQPTPTMPVGGTRLALALVAGSLAVAGVVTMTRAWTDGPPTADTIVGVDEPPAAAPTRALIPLDDRVAASKTGVGFVARHDATPTIEKAAPSASTTRGRARRRQRDAVIAAATLHELPRLEPDALAVPRAQPQPDPTPEGGPDAVAAPDVASPDATALEPSVPEPSVPEPSVPEPSVPEPSVPEATAPEATSATRAPIEQAAAQRQLDATETTTVDGPSEPSGPTDEVPVAHTDPAPSAVAIEAAPVDDGEDPLCLDCGPDA